MNKSVLYGFLLNSESGTYEGHDWKKITIQDDSGNYYSYAADKDLDMNKYPIRSNYRFIIEPQFKMKNVNGFNFLYSTIKVVGIEAI